MSTLATAILAEDDALEELTRLHERTLKTKAERMKIIEFMRKAAHATTKLSPKLLVITGLPYIINSPYTEDTDPIPLLRASLRNLSRDTTLLIQIDKLDWNPTSHTTVTIEGKPFPVSEIDIQGTLTLKEHIKLGATRGRKRDNYVKVKL
jgi:hypothetical protein